MQFEGIYTPIVTPGAWAVLKWQEWKAGAEF